MAVDSYLKHSSPPAARFVVSSATSMAVPHVVVACRNTPDITDRTCKDEKKKKKPKKTKEREHETQNKIKKKEEEEE